MHWKRKSSFPHKRTEQITEKDLQDFILAAAEVGGWLHYHTHDSRRSPAGFPDLVLVRGSQIILVELKTQRGRVSPAQTMWLEALENVQTISSGLIRPADAGRFVQRLTEPITP